MGTKLFLEENCYEAAIKRISYIFDNFENINVSVSGGKDSTALYWICVNEAVKRTRKITVFFLDQEAEYGSTIEIIEQMMRHPNVVPEWYQVPIYMTNATSFQKEMLYAWGEGEKWMREKSEIAIHSISEKYPKRFYEFFKWKERRIMNTAFLVGLRSGESINRFRAVTKNPGYNNILWSSVIPKNKTSFKFYPIYDWGIGDVWKFISDNELPYNSIYDKMFSANHNYYNTMRVSNLIHEKSFHCLTELQALEPETYQKLLDRISGVHCASLYAKDKYIYDNSDLPESFSSWRAYRDYILETTPYEKKERFIKRFDGQPKTEDVYQQQVKQLLTNDWENNLALDLKKQDKKNEVLTKWYAIL